MAVARTTTPSIDVLVIDDRSFGTPSCDDPSKPLGVEVSRGCEELFAGLRDVRVAVIRSALANCIAFSTRLRERLGEDAPQLVFVTPLPATAEEIERAYALGAADVLSEPVMPTLLRARVRALLGARRPGLRRATVDAATTRRARELGAAVPENVGLLVIDSSRNIVHCNAAALSILAPSGGESAQVNAERLLRLLRPTFDRCFRGELRATPPLPLVIGEASLRVSVESLRIAGEAPAMVACLLTPDEADITDLKVRYDDVSLDFLP